jgi:hypothetical protein
MVTVQHLPNPEPTANPAPAPVPAVTSSRPIAAFPEDLAAQTPPPHLLDLVQTAAHRASGGPWLELLRGAPCPTEPDDLLVLLAYAYLRGIYHSLDIVQALDADPLLASRHPRLGVRPEQVRHFRRRNRATLTDTLAHTLLLLWREHHPNDPEARSSDSLVRNRHHFGFLEPFHRQARERLDRAVVLDSMALDV